MSMYPGNSIGGPRRQKPWLLHGITAILGLVGLATVIGLLAAVVMLASSGDDLEDFEEWAGWFTATAVALPLVLGLTACGLMMGTILMYRHLARFSEQMTAIDQQTAVVAEQSVARTQADPYAGQTVVDPAETRDLLAKIHETLLLPDEERSRRFEQMMEREFADRLASTQRFIDAFDFHRARGELASLIERFGADPRIQEAQERLDKAAEAAAADDIGRITRHVEELMGSVRWDDAERICLELAQRYPLAQEPAPLLERVRRERKLFAQQHRQRMHDEIQRAVSERRWQEALAGARQFTQTFPTGPDADALRAQMDTLEANADIQARQGLERRYKQYIRQQQYWDALALARRIITEHPLSPQANALRGQVARLEELARAQGPHA